MLFRLKTVSVIVLAVAALAATFTAAAKERPMSQFAVLMRESDNAWGKLSPEEQQKLLKRYYEWVDELKSKDILRGGEPLQGGGRLLRAVGGEVVDGPFTETKEVLTGFFIIEAKGWDEAVAIAKKCPALSHGESVELRMIGH